MQSVEPIMDNQGYQRYRVPMRKVVELCERISLPEPIEIRRLERGRVGALFLIVFEKSDSLVLKVFVRRTGLSQLRNGEYAARCVNSETVVSTPAWLHASEGDELIPYPYAVMEFALGEDADEIWENLDRNARSRLMVDCAEALRSIHCGALSCEGPDDGMSWVASHASKFSESLESLQAQGWMSSSLIEKANSHWMDRSDAFVHVEPLVYTHHDFYLHNLRIDARTGQLVSVLDFDNATMWPSVTDVRDLKLNVFSRDPELGRVFWGAYGEPSDQAKEILRLHCFCRVLAILAANSGPVPGLDMATVESLIDEAPN